MELYYCIIEYAWGIENGQDMTYMYVGIGRKCRMNKISIN